MRVSASDVDSGLGWEVCLSLFCCFSKSPFQSFISEKFSLFYFVLDLLFFLGVWKICCYGNRILIRANLSFMSAYSTVCRGLDV